MAKFALSKVSSLVVLLAGFASAAATVKDTRSLEARYFPTCGITTQGLRTSATLLSEALISAGSISLDVSAISPNVGLVASTADPDTGITTYVGAFSTSGTDQVTTYGEAGEVVEAILSNCAFTGTYVAGSMALPSNDNLVIQVYGTYN